MLHAWRVIKRRYRRQAFDGEGARLLGGRWNSPGTAVVYCSESLALATLEILVHLGDRSILASYLAFPVDIPDPLVEAIDPARLPSGWKNFPAPPALQRIGDDWVKEARTVALRVPSALVEVESNFLLNPVHRDWSKVRVGRARALSLDPRLVKRP